MEWYYMQDGKRFGPLDTAGITQLVKSGKLTNNDLAWNQSVGGEWRKIGDIPELVLKPKQRLSLLTGTGARRTVARKKANLPAHVKRALAQDPEELRALTEYTEQCLREGWNPDELVETLRDEKHMPHQDADELVTAIMADIETRKRNAMIMAVCGAVTLAAVATVIYFVRLR